MHFSKFYAFQRFELNSFGKKVKTFYSMYNKWFGIEIIVELRLELMLWFDISRTYVVWERGNVLECVAEILFAILLTQLSPRDKSGMTQFTPPRLTS